MLVIDKKSFKLLLLKLQQLNYQLIGPTLNNGAIIYDKIESDSSLPIGWTDEQSAGIYRLIKRNDQAYFGYNSTPQSWKRFLHSPKSKFLQLKKIKNKITLTEENPRLPKLAFVGVRACDLTAIKILDKVFIDNTFTDSTYQKQRQNIFIISVNCTQAGSTCFCSSMKTGPKAVNSFDLSLTEVIENDRHYFLVTVGSERGDKILKDIPHKEANELEINSAENAIQKTASEMVRKVETDNIKELLYRNSENKNWHETAKRCLNCANCTMACPTCFCTTIEDVTDLAGNIAERWRLWDSCFTMDFSYIHGGSIRPSVYARYRHWLTHKFAAWQDQFGTIGCVGCGRCITWCPVGIDITEEIKEIQKNDFANNTTRLIK